MPLERRSRSPHLLLFCQWNGDQKSKLDAAVRRTAEIIEEHLSTLPPTDAKKSTDHFGEQMELISGDLKDPRISGDIEKEVKEILDALGPRLPQVQKDPRNIGELAELYDVRRARRQPRALAPVKIDEAGCVEKVEAELLEPGA